MELNETINKRYACRRFKNTKVSDELIDEILKACQKAPSAKNQQPTHIYVVKKDEDLIKLRNITPSAYNAPVVLIFTANKDLAWSNPYSFKNSYEIDATIMATYAMLKATDLNLASVFVCWYKENLIKKEFNIQDEIVCILPIGYPDLEPSANHNKRKDINELVTKL